MAEAAPPPPPLGRAAVPAAERISNASLAPLAIGVVVVAALYLARDVLIPITIAVLLSFVLAPLAAILRRLKIGRAAATLTAVILAFGVIFAVAAALGTQVAELTDDLPRYQATIREKIDTARAVTIERMSDVLRGLGRELREAPAAQKPVSPTEAASAASPRERPPLPVEVRERPPSPFDLAEQFVGPVLGPLATVGIILVVTVFILMQREDLRDRLIRLFGSSDLHRTTAAMDDAARRLSKYFLAQLGLNTLFGVIAAVGLSFIGVPSFALWGILAALMRFVPYVGAAISSLPPLLLAAAVDPGWSMMVWTLVLFFTVDIIIGQAVEPIVYGHSTGLSPVAVVVAAIFWTWLWGPVGLLLSTPMTLCLVVLGRHIDQLEFIDVLLGDRPALTPAQNCYQRLLAGDSDEIVAYAEALLRERSLSSYYDEVVLEGLRLAAADATRGVLTRPQIELINETVAELLEDLDDYPDVDHPGQDETDDGPAGKPAAERDMPREPAVALAAPPPEERGDTWRGARPVLCIAGRGPLDESAARMAAQLLGKHGIGARILPHAATSALRLGDLPVEGVAAAGIFCVGLSGSPAHIRYLSRRLRSRLPAALLLAGFWREEAAMAEPAHGMEAIDIRLVSLRQLIADCVEAASQAGEPAAQAPGAQRSLAG
jgi:predicted PurR-regulated permease PerM